MCKTIVFFKKLTNNRKYYKNIIKILRIDDLLFVITKYKKMTIYALLFNFFL